MTLGRRNHLQYDRPLAAPHHHTRTAAFDPNGKRIHRTLSSTPAEYSSSIVMAKNDGVWWPALLPTSNDLASLKNDLKRKGESTLVGAVSLLWPISLASRLLNK